MSDQVRVILWATPRTHSSVLLKSLSNIPQSQMIFEIYSSAYFYGPDKLTSEPTASDLDGNGLLAGQGSGFKSSICSFEWAKRRLEADYRGKRIIISKEMAPWLDTRYDVLPKGYRHVFLIRNPYKMFPSLKKLKQEILELNNGIKISMDELILDQLPPGEMPPGLTYKEISDLWQHIKENNLDPDPIIIDSDELLKNPREVLSSVCSRLGIPYSDHLLSWETGTKIVEEWIVGSRIKSLIENSGHFHNFRNSTCFNKPKVESEVPDLATFTPDLQRCIQYSMPYYLQMFEQRLKC